MAIKTFTAGSVLTASDTNTYLANSGLVYVSTTTWSGATNVVPVNNCFSSTYDHYRVIISGVTSTNNSDNLRLQLGASTTGYYGVLIYGVFGSSSVNAATDNNAALWSYAGNATNSHGSTSFDLLNPYLAKNTFIKDAIWTPTNASGSFSGVHQVQTSYTGFSIYPLSGNITGGSIVVYGYRKV